MTSQSAPAPGQFSDFALSPEIHTAIESVGYETPSPVQAAAIPVLLEGFDLLATAQTGTGKTAAFALPLLSRLDLEEFSPQILVLAPTRELAIQVSEAFETYASDIRGFRSLAVYGGQSMKSQLDQLRRGVHVVVGTPGRVMDHLRRKSLKLSCLQALVLDEADEMLRMGFIDDVEWILEHTPEEKQVALFSATMPKPIRKIASNYLVEPQEINIEPDTKAISSIEQQYWPINKTKKFEALTRLLEAEPVDGAVVFVRTKNMTVEVSDKLELQGFKSAPINGDMNQALRERTIQKLKDQQIDILVATDVAARGIDVARISHVFNYDMPFDSDVYTHRIGRTGRAGRSGKAILFVNQREKRLLKSLEKATKSTIEQIELPTPSQIRKMRVESFKQRVVDVDVEALPEVFKKVTTELLEGDDKSPEQIATALVYLAQQSKPFYSPKAKRPESDSASSERAGDRGSRRSKRGGDRTIDRAKRDKPRAGKAAKRIVDEAGEEVKMETYKIKVGYADEVSPGDIVGAIANEADISSQYIGRIDIQDDYSTVDLPEGMPKEILKHLKKVRVKSRKLEMERMDSQAGEGNTRSVRKAPVRQDKKTAPKSSSGKKRNADSFKKKPGAKRAEQKTSKGSKKPGRKVARK